MKSMELRATESGFAAVTFADGERSVVPISASGSNFRVRFEMGMHVTYRADGRTVDDTPGYRIVEFEPYDARKHAGLKFGASP